VEELTALPRPPSWILGALLLREGRGKGREGKGGEERGGKGGEREGKGTEGEGGGRKVKGGKRPPKGWLTPPMFRILENTLTRSIYETAEDRAI